MIHNVESERVWLEGGTEADWLEGRGQDADVRWEIQLCEACFCMTKRTAEGNCGKCGSPKQPHDQRHNDDTGAKNG